MLDAGVKMCLGKIVLGISLTLNVVSSVAFEILQDLKRFPESVASTYTLALHGVSLTFRPGVCQAPG